MNTLTLKQILDKLLESLPQLDQKKEKNLFDISGYPHYEIVLSNWYKFFLSLEEHHLGPIFLETLLGIIRVHDDYHNFEFETNNFEVYSEYSTNKGRIDLLIVNLSDDGNFEKAIIIENKVNHALNNDLKDYWDSINLPDDSKAGVVLSLSNIGQDVINNQSKGVEKNFIGVTHKDFMREVKNNLGNVILNIRSRHFGYLKDLIENIEKFGDNMDEKEAFEFQLTNDEDINKVLETLDLSSKYVENLFYSYFQEERGGGKILKWNRASRIHRNISLVFKDIPEVNVFFYYKYLFETGCMPMGFYINQSSSPNEEKIRKINNFLSSIAEKGFYNHGNREFHIKISLEKDQDSGNVDFRKSFDLFFQKIDEIHEGLIKVVKVV